MTPEEMRELAERIQELGQQPASNAQLWGVCAEICERLDKIHRDMARWDSD